MAATANTSTARERRIGQMDLTGSAALTQWLAGEIGASKVAIAAAERLSGGAVQDNWRLDVDVADGPRQGRQVWVLRTDAAARLALSLDRVTEAAVIGAAHAQGVKVAEPMAACSRADLIGAPFMIQNWLPGAAQARRLIRDPALPSFGERLAGELALELARIHKMTPDNVALPTLTRSDRSPARTEVGRLRVALNGAGEARPALEYVLAWLDQNAPETERIGLVHGDFRTGNYLVQDGRLTGILDWEFAHWGDPREDIGWLTARCWRFGHDQLETGGIASLGSFLAAYAAASGMLIEPRDVVYWQIMAAAKWAVIAVLQGDRYRIGGEERLELALTGLMAPEMEYDALRLILTGPGSA